MVDNGKNVNVSDIDSDILYIKEEARVRKIIGNLYMYDKDPKELTNIYTNILLEDNVAFILTKVTQDPIFMKHFPEFYTKNALGENVINCQQNNSYHKYGVFKHILCTIEYVGSKELPIGDWQRKILKWTMFLHDIGKPYVKIVNEDGTESFAGHDDKSVELARNILERFSFDEEEKKIILTLIKYHDRYLNEGEIIFDNLKFLASELNNNKELFFMLIDVKEADAKAKSIDVYNKYKLTRKKYVEFLNSYFAYNTPRESVQEKTDNSQQPKQVVTVDENGDYEDVNLDSDGTGEIRSLKLKNAVEEAIDRKGIEVKYQPVVNLASKLVHGYEVFTHVSSNDIDIVELLNYSKNLERYDKLQQTLLINSIEKFNMQHSKESKLVFVNVDISSYNKYVNKPRLYDLMRNGKIAIEFQNYEREDINVIKNTINLIHENRGYVVFDNFGTGSFTVDDLNVLDVDYIVPDMSFVRGINENTEKQEYINKLVNYCIGKETNVIAVGVETKEELDTLKRIGVKYIQGNYIEPASFKIDIINAKLDDVLSDENNDILV